MTRSTKWPVRPAKTQISLVIRPVSSESLLSAWRKPWVLSYPLSAQRRLWSDWESSLGAQVILLVLSCFGSFYLCRSLSLSTSCWPYEARLERKTATLKPRKTMTSGLIYAVRSAFACLHCFYKILSFCDYTRHSSLSERLKFRSWKWHKTICLLTRLTDNLWSICPAERWQFSSQLCCTVQHKDWVSTISVFLSGLSTTKS